MLVSFFAGIAAYFMKIAFWFSHLKFIAALVTLDVHHIASHYTYTHVLAAVRPALMWRPL